MSDERIERRKQVKRVSFVSGTVKVEELRENFRIS